MAAIEVVAAAGIFILGAVAGIVAVVGYGIHREQGRLRGEPNIWAGSDAPECFLAEQAPDVVTGAARRLNGLYVRHLPSQSPDDDAWRRPPLVTNASSIPASEAFAIGSGAAPGS